MWIDENGKVYSGGGIVVGGMRCGSPDDDSTPNDRSRTMPEECLA